MSDVPSPTDDARPGAGGSCPVCGRPADPKLRPFCSKRCADIDLHRWLSGTYRVPVEDEPDDPEDDTLPRRPAQ